MSTANFFEIKMANFLQTWLLSVKDEDFGDVPRIRQVELKTTLNPLFTTFLCLLQNVWDIDLMRYISSKMNLQLINNI